MKNEKPKPTFVIDTREQNGHTYLFEGYQTVRAKLDTGDYSLLGSESKVAVERKSLNDAWTCCSSERERFTRCLERLARLDRAAIVIEASMETFALNRPSQIKKVTVATAIGSYLSWSCQYRIPIFWAGVNDPKFNRTRESREYAERTTLRFLYSYWKHRAGSNNGTLKISKPICLICGCICGRCTHSNGREDHTKVCIEEFVLGNSEKNFIDRMRLG